MVPFCCSKKFHIFWDTLYKSVAEKYIGWTPSRDLSRYQEERKTSSIRALLREVPPAVC